MACALLASAVSRLVAEPMYLELAALLPVGPAASQDPAAGDGEDATGPAPGRTAG
jgi:hypothetical protein